MWEDEYCRSAGFWIIFIKIILILDKFISGIDFQSEYIHLQDDLQKIPNKVIISTSLSSGDSAKTQTIVYWILVKKLLSVCAFKTRFLSCVNKFFMVISRTDCYVFYRFLRIVDPHIKLNISLWLKSLENMRAFKGLFEVF